MWGGCFKPQPWWTPLGGLSSVSDPWLDFHAEHLRDLGSTLWANTTPRGKAARETSKLELQELQEVKLQAGGRLLRRGHLGAQGLAGKHIRTASCEIFRLKKKKAQRRWELSSSSRELLMLSSGACSHVILLWILGNKSLPCPESISCLQSIFSCPNTVTPKGYASQPSLCFFFQNLTPVMRLPTCISMDLNQGHPK